jgi:hypothetical protein
MTISRSNEHHKNTCRHACEVRMSPLLGLPRELRDQIYSYVLYDLNGLLYERSKDGVRRLCVRPLALSSTKGMLARLRRASLGRILARRRRNRRELNQLKYVCRQLYDETKGFVMHQNLIFLQDTCSPNAIEQCLCLFRRWPMLRYVAIKCDSKTFASESGRSRLRAIVQHCIENAQVSVRVHIPYWTQADPNFVLQGLFYLLTLRRDTRLIARLARATSISYLSDPETEPFATNVQIPWNLRWLPYEEQFNRPLFERNVCRHPVLSMPSAQAALRDLVELVADWFTSGL